MSNPYTRSRQNSTRSRGCSLSRAGRLYNGSPGSASLRSLGFLATGRSQQDGKEIAKKNLDTTRNQCLRTIASLSTPIRSLETDTNVPPIDLYLNKAQLVLMSIMKCEDSRDHPGCPYGNQRQTTENEPHKNTDPELDLGIDIDDNENGSWS